MGLVIRGAYQLGFSPLFSDAWQGELLVLRKNVIGRAQDNIRLRYQRRVIFVTFEIIGAALRVLEYVLGHRQLLIIHDPAIGVHICAGHIRGRDNPSLNTIRVFCFGFS